MGLSFRVFLDHAPADADLARRLCDHLAALVRKGTVVLWHPGVVAAGAHAAQATRAALEDADLALFVLSADLLSCPRAYERLRRAYAREREGLVQLLLVLARPCDLDPDELPGQRPLLGGRALSAYANVDEACQEVVTALRLILDAKMRQPAFGARPTLRRVATEAFRLDRIDQWEQIRARRDHCLFLLYGRRGQAVSLFAERVCRLLAGPEAHEAPRLVLTVPVRNRVVNADDIEGKLRTALVAALQTEASEDTGALLQRLARRAPLFLVLGGVQDGERWLPRERQALAEFLSARLPGLLPREGHPVQALLMFEYERPETSLLPWVQGWAGALAGPLRFCALPEAELPSWAEVEELLQRKQADAETFTALHRFYDELTSSASPSFERLADELDAYLY